MKIYISIPITGHDEKTQRANARYIADRLRADKDPNKKTYISMCGPDPNNCPCFWREKGGAE